MARWLKGESVKVYRREVSSLDDLDEPKYIWLSESVDNVLVNPGVSSDLSDTMRPDGVKISYTLYFPKTYKKDLTHCKIALTDRGMTRKDALAVIGTPDRYIPCPTDWNMVVLVGRTDG